jgi:tetratricopeptide (TPR) repeat protein
MSLESIQEPIVGNCGSSSVAHLPLIRQLVTHLIAHYNGTQKEPADLAEKLLQVLNSPQEAHRQFLKWLCPLQDGEFFSEEVLKEWADHAECREALRKGLRQLAGSPSKESPQQRDGGSSPEKVPDSPVLTARDVEQLQWAIDLQEAQESLESILQYGELVTKVMPEDPLLTARTPFKETGDPLGEMKNSEMGINKRRPKNDPKSCRYNYSERLRSTLPASLESVVRTLLNGLAEELQLMSSGRDQVDDSPYKEVLETLRTVQHGLMEQIHEMDSVEQLYYAYMIDFLSRRLVGYQGSPEQLQSSVAFLGLVATLLSIAHGLQVYLCKKNDGLLVLVPAFRVMVLKGRLVLVHDSAMTEAFEWINSSDSQLQRFLKPFGDQAQARRTAAYGQSHEKRYQHDIRDDNGDLNLDGSDEAFGDKEEMDSLSEILRCLPEESSFGTDFSSGGNEKEERVKYPPHSRLQTGINGDHIVEIIGEPSGNLHVDSRHAFNVAELKESPKWVALYLKKGLYFFSLEINKRLVLDTRDGSKLITSPEVDPTSDVYVEDELRSFDSQVTSPTIIGTDTHFVKEKVSIEMKHHVEFRKGKSFKTPEIRGLQFNSAAVIESVRFEHCYVRETIQARNLLARTSSVLPPPPSPATLWCWKRRLEPVTNVHAYIGNAGQAALEELDTECQETICHAIPSVFVANQAVCLIRTLFNNSIISHELLKVQDKHGNTPLHSAVMSGDVEVVNELVGLYRSAIFVVNSELATPLDIAMSHKNNEVVDCLLRECVRSDPHSTHTAELLQSCLVTAMKIGYPHYLKTLLQLHSEYELTIDFYYTDSNGHTAWQYLEQRAQAVRAAAVEVLQGSNLSCKLLTKLLTCFCQSSDSGETSNVEGVTSSEPKHTSHSDPTDEYRNSVFTFEHKLDLKQDTDEEIAETTIWLPFKQSRSKLSFPCKSTDSDCMETPSDVIRLHDEPPSDVTDLSSGSFEKDEPLPLSERKYPVTCETCEVNEGTISPVVVVPTVAAEPEEPHHLTLTTALAQIDRLKNRMNRLAVEKDRLAAENNNLVAEVEKLKEPHTSDEEHTMCPTACLSSTSESTDNSPFVTAADNVGTPDYTSAEESGGASGKNRPLRYPQPYTDSVTPSDDLSSPQKPSVSERVKKQRKRAKLRFSLFRHSTSSGSDNRKQPRRRSLRPLATLRGRVDSFSEPEKSSPSSEENSTSTPPTSDIAVEERLAKLKTRHRCSGKRQVDWMSRSEKTPPLTVASFFGANGKFNKKILKRISSVIHKAGYCHLRYEIHQQLFPIFGFSPLKHKLTRRERKIARTIFDVVGSKRDSIPPSIVDNLEVLEKILKDREQQDQVDAEDERGKKRLAKGAASLSSSKPQTLKPLTQSVDRENQPPDDTEVDGFTTPPTETPPSISYGSARPSAAETTTTISPQCREEESSGLSVLEFTNSSNPLDVIHSHMKVYSKCCPRHDIRSVVIGTTYPPSDAFGPKRRYSSIKDIHSDPSHSQFDCTKKLSAQSSSNRHYRDSESQQIMFERPSPESVLRQNRGALPPKLHSPSLVQSLMETTESHPSPPLSSRQQTSQLHHPTENLAQGRSKNSEAAVVTVANREASAENPESTRRLENSIQSRQSTSFLDSQTVPRDHKERIRGTAELLHAQDYTRILPLAYEGDPPDSLPPLLKIPFVFITGLAYYKLSNHKKSVQFFTKCLALADDCGRDGDITICNIYIGDIDFAKRRYSEAAGRYQTALQHYSRESVAQDFRMVMPTRSAVWLKCGSAFKNASRVGDSVAAYEKAIEIAASKKDQLSAHTSLGNLYQGIGENGRAVKEYEAAIELAQDLEDNVSLGWNHGNLGNALLGLHQRDKALHHLFKALDMAVEFETTPQAIGRAYNNLGTAFQSLNELAKAEEHYDLALAQAIYGNDIPGQARVYGNIGNLQMLNKLYDRAVPHYTEVMRLSQDKATITTAHHNRGCAYYDWAEKKKTAAMPKGPTSGGRNSSAQEPRGPTRSSVPHAGRSSAPRSIATRGREVEIKGQQSSRHLTVSDSDSSSDDEPRTTESCFRVSLHGPDFERCEDIFRPHIVTPAIQKYYLQGTRDLEYVIKHHEENFSGIKGSSKGLSLSVSLFETNSRTFHRMQDCMVHIQKGEEQPIRYEDALLVAEQSRARTLGELMLRRRGPQLEHELMSPPSLFQMKAIVGRQSCPVVYLSYTGERLLGWLLYPTSDNQSSIVNMFEVPLSDNEFDGKSLDYHLRYSLNEQLVEKSFEMYKPFDYEKEKTEPLEKLYDLVARPVMRMLSTLDTKHSLQQGSAETFPVQHNRGKKKGGLRKIVVIPDSYTNLLPFTCVLNKDTGKFWGDDYYFQIMPSLLTMGILDQLPTVSVTIPVQYQQMLCVVGNPNIPRFKFNNEDWDLGKLPHATKEAEWVSHILQCKPILHEQATKDAVLMRIMNAKVIHLATHGSAVAGFLAFAGMTSSSSEAVDAKRVLIYPDEIESLNISPALVVLSSCDSGRGVFKADGIQGMARAFILAGAQAVLTALWRVPDESACIFMQFFYQYLVEGMRGTQALHKAILCLRCFSKYSQYIHWSGYQLTGREFQFSVSQSSSRAQLATRLGTSSVFPRLDILKNLETAFLNNPKLPTDVQVLHAPPGVKPSEPLVDFIHCHHTHFSGGIFWVNCRTPQLIEASLTAIKNCLRLKELSELPFLESHPTLVVLYYLDHFPKEDDSPLLSLLKHSSVHIVVVSKTAFPEQLQKSAHNQLIRGTNIINIKPLSTIHATQRLVHSALQNHHLTPSKTEQVLFEKLAEFTTGSPPIIDLTNSLLDLTLTRTDASASTEDALKDFASGVRLSELPQQKPLSVPREHLSSQPQEQFLRTPVRDVSRELYETIKKDGEEDVFITSAKYDSWQVVTVLIQHCDLTPEERLLLFCLSSFNCCPIPASYVTEIATIITKAAHQSHLASTLHNKLRDSKMLKVYPKPLIYHPNYPNSSTDEETDIDFVYIPRFISAAVWKDMMSDFDKVMALTTCYKALQISASQYQNLVGQSKQSTAENLQVLHLLGAASILVESFGQHFKLVGRLCFQQVYTIFVQLHRQPQPQVKSLDHL